MEGSSVILKDGVYIVFFFQAEDGIRDLVRSRGLGDVYKRQTRNRLRWDRSEPDRGQEIVGFGEAWEVLQDFFEFDVETEAA